MHPLGQQALLDLWQVHFLLHLLRKIYFPKLSKPPYICNGCYQRTRCSLEKHLYKASYTQKEYEQDRSESRSGFAFSKSKIKQLDDVVSSLIKKEQFLQHISVYHTDELTQSEGTLYTDIITVSFMPEPLICLVLYACTLAKNVSQKLKEYKSCYIGRDFQCFENYLDEQPVAAVRQLDSVEGTKCGAVLLTIHFVEQGLQLASSVSVMIPNLSLVCSTCSILD